MRRQSLISLVSLVLLSTTLACAQQTVLLRHKFVSGATTTYNLTGTGVIPTVMDLGEGMGGAMSFSTNIDLRLRMVQQCTSVDSQGWGQVVTTTPYLQSRTTTALEQQTVEALITWENRNLSIVVNGEAQPLDAAGQQMAQMLSLSLPARISPLGQMQIDPAAAKMMATLSGAGLVGMPDIGSLSAITSEVPAEPVAQGARWSRQVNLSSGGTQVTGSAQFVLSSVGVVNGQSCARIDGQAQLTSTGNMVAGSAPGSLGQLGQSSITGLQMSLTFSNWLDIQSGKIIASTVDLTQNANMVISMGELGGQAIKIPARIENAQIHLEQRAQ